MTAAMTPMAALVYDYASSAWSALGEGEGERGGGDGEGGRGKEEAWELTHARGKSPTDSGIMGTHLSIIDSDKTQLPIWVVASQAASMNLSATDSDQAQWH